MPANRLMIAESERLQALGMALSTEHKLGCGCEHQSNVVNSEMA
jgi:hypothetical protein